MTQFTIRSALNLALQHHQAGRLQEAEQLYRQILAHQPEQPDALHYLGLIAFQRGENDAALDLIRCAIAINPNLAEAHINLGIALAGNRKRDEAIPAFRKAIAINPSLMQAHYNLGTALREQGKLDEAIASYRQAIALNPGLAKLHNDLGIVLTEQGRLDEAIAAYRQVIALNPNLPEAHTNLGKALTDKGKYDEAITALHQAIALNPNLAKAHNNLGMALAGKGQLEEAIAAYHRAIVLDSKLSEAHNNLGNALRDQGKLDEAIIAYRNAIALNPKLPEAHSNLGNALRDQGQLDAAIAAYRVAIALDPDLPEPHNNLAMALLSQGDFQHGWAEYEWRSKCKDFPSPRRNFTQPRWDGSPLQGRTILLYAEQGLGDAIQFIRYLPLVMERGGKIILECQPELQRLFQSIDVPFQIVASGQPLPAFDFQSPLLSLPSIFGTTLKSIPKPQPFSIQDSENWRQRLIANSPKVNVGLAWAGSPTHKNDRNRSMNLTSLTPLAQVPGPRFISLQKGNAAATPPTGMELLDWTPELKDFADTAALIANLDLVITVDTAVAHLAGTMGKPVWTMLPFVPEWRWLLEREESPWYPSIRLFRQKSLGDWENVVTRVADALSLWIKNRA